MLYFPRMFRGQNRIGGVLDAECFGSCAYFAAGTKALGRNEGGQGVGVKAVLVWWVWKPRDR